jgi:hypothetical protein
MDRTVPATEHPAPFQRPMAAARLRRDVETPFRITAEPGELALLARFLDVARIDRLSFAGFIAPFGKDGWRVRGRLVAKIEQACVVSLEPVRSRHDAEIERRYLPAYKISPTQDVVVALDDDDLPDPFTDVIDPGQLAVESLALMIDPYPRAKGAELGSYVYTPPGAEPLSDEASQPFASLALLKRGADENDR